MRLPATLTFMIIVPFYIDAFPPVDLVTLLILTISVPLVYSLNSIQPTSPKAPFSIRQTSLPSADRYTLR